jgi:hypothetical protein
MVVKTLLPLALLALAAPLAATPAPQHLSGVSDEETRIPSGGITQYRRGNGDVLFVLDRAGRWYRLGLNQGCLSNSPHIYSITFGYSDNITRVDRFTKVVIKDSNGALGFSCQIDSIRRSEAPPQVDSKSPVTLD